MRSREKEADNKDAQAEYTNIMKRLDISGQRFGKLLCLWLVSSRPYTRWAVQCDCGTVKMAHTTSLIRGRSTSCGCTRIVHGAGMSCDAYKAVRRELTSWRNMLERCYNPKSENWRYYGAKGRTVCQRWQESFTNFLNDMGPRPPKTTLDRIDTTGNYEPGNCRWATATEQIANRNLVRVGERPCAECHRKTKHLCRKLCSTCYDRRFRPIRRRGQKCGA